MVLPADDLHLAAPRLAVRAVAAHLCNMSNIMGRGLYIGKYHPPLGGGKNISRCHLGEKIWKGEKKKGENVKEKGRKGEEKGRKEKEMRKEEVKG